MANKTNKKSGFMLTPINLSEPIRATDGFTNLVETSEEKEKTIEPQAKKQSGETETKKREVKRASAKIQNEPRETVRPENTAPEDTAPKIVPPENAAPEKAGTENTAPENTENNEAGESDAEGSAESETQTLRLSLTTSELLRILDAGSLDEIYELTDVLRASSLKLYATLIRLADSRGRARVKNHELMSKAGIKGIATLYKQERWLMDLKLLEKKAKPGPHDGSSYVVHKLETLPLPDEIFEKFDDYLSGFEQNNQI